MGARISQEHYSLTLNFSNDEDNDITFRKGHNSNWGKTGVYSPEYIN